MTEPLDSMPIGQLGSASRSVDRFENGRRGPMLAGLAMSARSGLGRVAIPALLAALSACSKAPGPGEPAAISGAPASGRSGDGLAGSSGIGGKSDSAGAAAQSGAAGVSSTAGMNGVAGGAGASGSTAGNAGSGASGSGAAGRAGSSGGSGAAGSSASGPVTFSKNIRLNDDTGSGNQSEVALAGGPNGLLLAGWMDERAERVCAFSFSTDSGLTWSKNVSIPNTASFVGDPAVAIDGGGTMYAVCQQYLNSNGSS
ncbi:MAG TPA: hypothetical protein VGI70_02420, partial [Polyangiales bacterium]